MKSYPFLTEYAFRKPYKDFESVQEAFDYAVRLADLGLSAVAAGKAGYLQVIPPISKRRAGIWVKQGNLHFFERAEQEIQQAVEESENVRMALVQGRLDKSLDQVAEVARTSYETQFDPGLHLDNITKLQVRFDRALNKYRSLLPILKAHPQLGSLEAVTDSFKRNLSRLEEAQDPMAEALADELQGLEESYRSSLASLGVMAAHARFREEFTAWTAEENIRLTVRNVVAKAADFLVSSLANQDGQAADHPQYDRYLKGVRQLESGIELEPFLDQLSRVSTLVERSFGAAAEWTVHAQAGTGEMNPFGLEGGLILACEAPQVDLKAACQPLIDSYRQLEQKSEYGFSHKFEIHTRGRWELQLNYQFKFRDQVEGYPCHLKLEGVWKDQYKGLLSHKRTRRLLLSLEPDDAASIGRLELLEKFLEQGQLPTTVSLLKKREKFLETCAFFISQHQEREGFHDFAQNPNAFACGSLKQVKNFKAVLEKRFADFSLARLATNHADIFMGRRDKRVRKVIFYAGPTNSGKSYMAFEELAAHETGVYLGPLRLLALEGVEELQKRGRKTSLITGEERDIVPGASHLSQTIETFDREASYDCAIIDEIQLVSDKGRGGAFMEAFLNINADKVVLTGSDNAVAIIEEITSLTGDIFEVRRLERKNPLRWIGRYPLEKTNADELKGTAIVAFTKKSIHMIRNRLLRDGYTVSVIYGALSPDVRRSEAERFRSGETDILVATDAIGMGLNLPIKRVLFSQSDKFDGEMIRDLEGTEVMQIGGRAGRYGMFQEAGEVGVVPGLTKFQVDETVIRDGFYGTLDTIEHVYVSITYRQLWDSYQTLGHELSAMIQTLAAKNQYTWQKARQAHMVDSERYEKALILEQAASKVAEEVGIDKTGTKALRAMHVGFPLIFRMLNTPFDASVYDEVLLESFENILRVFASLTPYTQWVDVDTAAIKGSVALERAENQVKALTLHYYFASYFERMEASPYELSPDEILLLRKEVGIQIANYLAKNETLDGVIGPGQKGGRRGAPRRHWSQQGGEGQNRGRGSRGRRPQKVQKRRGRR